MPTDTPNNPAGTSRGNSMSPPGKWPTREGGDPSRSRHSLESRTVDWGQAVCAAAGRLNEAWALPQTTCHPAGAGVEEELAALLCAYGVLTTEVDRMRDRGEVTYG